MVISSLLFVHFLSGRRLQSHGAPSARPERQEEGLSFAFARRPRVERVGVGVWVGGCVCVVGWWV